MRTRLLLDTCAAIWITEDAPFDKAAAARIDEAFRSSEPIHVSPMTAWERGLLAAKGRIMSPVSPYRWFELLIGELGFALADLTPSVLIDSSFLPGDPPNDPVDRIIIATARAFDFTIVTRDRAILDYAETGHARSLVC